MSDVQQPSFKNLIKSFIGLGYVKQGLQAPVDRLVQRHHKEIRDKCIKDKRASQCTTCTLDTLLPDHKRNQCIHRYRNKCLCNDQSRARRPCPNNFCSYFYDQIVLNHSERNPTLANTDPTRWYSDYWSLAQCFMSTHGYADKHSASETDCSGLIAIILNNGKIVNSHIECEDNFRQVRDIRNDIMHAGDADLSDKELTENIDNMIAVLKDKKLFETERRDAETAVEKLEKLKLENVTLLITSEDLIQMVDEALKKMKNNKQGLIQLKRKVLKNVKTIITDKKECVLNDILLASNMTLNKINEKASEVESKLQTTMETHMKNIKQAEESCQHDLKINANTYIDALDTEAKQHQKCISDITNTCKKELEEKAKSLHQEILYTRHSCQSGGANGGQCEHADHAVPAEKQKINEAGHDCDSQSLSGQKRKSTDKLGDNTDSSAAKRLILGSSDQLSGSEKVGDTMHEIQGDGLKCICLTQDLDTVGHLEQISGTGMRSETSSSAVGSDNVDEYLKLKAELLEDLILNYITNHEKIPVSPLVPMNDDEVLKFFVEPTLEIIEGNTRTETRKKINTFSDIFVNDSNFPHNIYLTGQAGLGKTTFTKWLCMIWCRIKEVGLGSTLTNMNKADDEMRKFDFLFYVPLREAQNIREVEDMVLKEMRNLPEGVRYTMSFLEKLLRREKCLVILDGLDEWSMVPSVPHKKVRKKCDFLSTTRQWKLHGGEMANENITRLIEMTGIGIASREALIKKVMAVFGETNEKTVGDIQNAIKEKGIEELAAIPVILTHLTCLWIQDQTFGNTQCEIYCNIFELILQRGESREYPIHTDSSILKFKHEGLIENMIKLKEDGCSKYRTLLFAMGKISCDALFSDKGTSTVIMESQELKLTLSDQQLEFVRNIGLLTQNKSRFISKFDPNYSFIHKTFQEFLCAFYLVHLSTNSCVSIILSVCTSLKTIIEMENVFIFICGLDMGRFNILSPKLSKIVTEDENTRDHRCRIRAWFDVRNRNKLLQAYQQMIISCLKESRAKEMRVYLGDIFISGDSFIYGIRLLEQFIPINEQLKSLTMVDLNERQFCETMNIFISHQKLDCLEKFDLYGEVDGKVLDSVLGVCSRTLKCLSVASYTSTEGSSKYNSTPLLASTVPCIQRMNKLESLTLECFVITHDQLKTLIQFISENKEMREVRLLLVSCKEHNDIDVRNTCSGFELNLSNHKHLHSFELENVPIAKLELNATSLDECFVGQSSSSNVLTSFITELHNAKAMKLFTCSKLTSSEYVEKCLEAVSKMTGLNQLTLKGIDLTQADLLHNIKDLKQLHVLWFSRSKLSVQLLEQITDLVKSFQESVRVVIHNCKVSTFQDFETFWKKIVASNDLKIFEQRKHSSDEYMFSFETCK